MKPTRTKMPPKVPFKPPVTPARSNPSLKVSRDKDPVHVYCRLRPLETGTEESCITILNDTTVQVVPPETSQGYRSGTTKATQYTFTGVFDDKVSQKTIFHTVTLPLVEDLLHGKNSLLFAYGVTGSGKTHTMNGELQDGGIIPRCLDVIFNSIGQLQAKKYTFKPDRMNSFEIQSDADSHADRQAEISQMNNKFKTPASRRGQENDGPRVSDATRISAIDEDQTYAVFITFAEVYNNTVFDLLDDTPIDPLRPGKIQAKILREDQHHNMYVNGVTEVEVKSADEAAEILLRGQKRRRVAHTTLNAESSRSHSVFNIRVVQAPLDYQGSSPEKVIIVGQLSLVDLAGSERNNRTKTQGDRLREAGSINNTLMTLRSCIEILRENQQNGTAKMVPYRDSKITHLFKSYFDGEGKVRMIVCVNPRADDYDETLSVMRFAEMAQDVQIARAVQPNIRLEATPRSTPALLPGRRKANRVLTEAYNRLEQAGIVNPQAQIPFDIDMVFSSARCAWPPLELQSASDDRLINNLIEYLQVRIREQQNRREQQMKKCVDVRTMIAEMEDELILKRQEVQSLRAEVQAERSRCQTFESRVLNAESTNASLQKHLAEHQKYARLLEDEIKEKDGLLNQGEVEIQSVKAKERAKRLLEREKCKKELDRYRSVENQMAQQRERFMAMRDLLDAECRANPSTGPSSVSSVSSNELAAFLRTPSVATPRPRISDPRFAAATPSGTPMGTPSLRGPAVSTRKRRSRSADPGELHHRPASLLELDNYFQPKMSRGKSITKLVDSKDVTDPKVSRYTLTTQEQDSRGEIETKLYKGDVLTTVGGGAQVVLQDVEILHHASPMAVKRHSDGRPIKDVLARVVDIEKRCGTGIEGHRSKKHCP